VDDIHEAYEVLKEREVAILKEPYELSGCWHLEILDPDGNMIVIHYRKDGTIG